MRLTDSNGDIEGSPNQLTLTNSSVKNIFYAMNSLISFTSVGGLVTFTNSQFEKLHTCGGIVKDQFSALGDPSLRNHVSADYLSDSQLAKIEQILAFQVTYGGQTQTEYYMDSVSDSTADTVCTLDYCTNIVIEDSTSFTDIPFNNQRVWKNVNLVSEDNGLRNLGYIVTLENSVDETSLTITESKMTRVKAPYDGCTPYDQLTASNQSKTAALGSLNNFAQLFNPAISDVDSAFTQAQVSGPIVIRDHTGPITIFKSTFDQTISYSGAISIDQISGAVWLKDNTFAENVALVSDSASALTLR